MPGSGVGRGDEATRATWEQTREISRWLDVSDGRDGVTMATTHRSTRVEPGADGRLAIRCCLVRGGRIRNPEPDANGGDPRVRLGFRFRFQPHAGSWQNARAPRIGWEATQPLFAYTVNDTWSPKSLPPRQALARVVPESGSGDALLTCLKQGEDGADVVARWYESTGADAQVDLAIGPVPTRNARVDLREKLVPEESWTAPTTRDRRSTRAWEIVTVRAK